MGANIVKPSTWVGMRYTVGAQKQGASSISLGNLTEARRCAVRSRTSRAWMGGLGPIPAVALAPRV